MATARAGLMLAVGLIGLAGCATAPSPARKEDRMEYLETVRALEAAGAPLAAGGEPERLAIERFQNLLADFKAPDFARRVGEVYADDVFFNDTLKTVRGAEAVAEYLSATAARLDKGVVEFLDVAAENGNYYFRWRMTIRSRRLARGAETTSIGVSHVRFDAAGKVALHQDYWDSTAGLFEHVPVLGWALKRIKKRL